MHHRFFILALLAMISCTEKPIKKLGDKTIPIFKNTHLYFDMAFQENPSMLKDNILHLNAGRVLVKKVLLPVYEKHAGITLNMSLTSNGDPWDKGGSLFVIPKKTAITLLDIENKNPDIEKEHPNYPLTKQEIIEDLQYIPNVELLRFMTPFGVGHFTDHERTKKRKPLYIPHWEKEVTWSQDITHLSPLLEEGVYIGVYIDTWTKEGYRLSVSLDYEESTISNHKKEVQEVISIANTVKYSTFQKEYDRFSQHPFEAIFTIDTPVKDATLHYITTGHGGHSGGDEFVKRENSVAIDEKTVYQFIPWRDDCASFRRFNPTSGIWLASDFMPEETSIDMIASSDLSRSNWCPGSAVVPERISISNLSAGIHSITIDIPEAQIAKEDEFNYWMVSAYLSYEEE